MAKLAPSSTDYLKMKNNHASQLEDELSMLPPKTSESKKTTLRVKLCELYSDMLLHDPKYASRKDCLNRLWRNCFYGHISESRSRLSKEQKRKGSNVAEISRSYAVFLEESVGLYNCLVTEYTQKLTTEGLSSQLSLSGAHMSSQDSEIPPTPTMSTEGVVSNLFRMFIQIGDLYRYSNDYDAADKAYLTATKLAPGKGNPYNQLAVVAAMRDTGAPLSCIAFYYYARSLLAVDDPFETSRTNLLKLLEQNRVWLQHHPVDVIPTGISSKKAVLELQRLKKSAASKRCLANFVDLHYDFVDTMDLSELQVIQKLSRLLSSFQDLVAVSAFGDSLLLKLVVVNAYSVSSGKECLARIFTLRFGTIIAERLEASLAKANESQKTKDPSIRLLSPLMLLADYCLSFSWSDLKNISELVANESRQAENAFWTQVAVVANLVQRLVTPGGQTPLSPKEYDSFRGYKPFCNFIDPPMDVYVTPQDAAGALQLKQSQASASTTQDEARAKMAYFMAIVARGEGTKVMRNQNGCYVLYALTTLVDDEDVSVIMDDAGCTTALAVVSSAVHSDEELEATGDVVMYKPSGKDGSGPALLVPGAFFLNQIDNDDPGPMKMHNAMSMEGQKSSSGVDISSLLRREPAEFTVNDSTDPMEVEQPVMPRQPPGLCLPKGLLIAQQPPPGFAPSVAHDPFGAPLEALNDHPIVPPGFSATSQPTMYASLFDYPIHTANPFYSPPQPDNLHGYVQCTDFLNDLDGATFLDKSLLDQLWSDDTSRVSKNPFLT